MWEVEIKDLSNKERHIFFKKKWIKKASKINKFKMKRIHLNFQDILYIITYI